MVLIAKKKFEVSGADLKAYYREQENFKADRLSGGGRVTYMAHGKGYVMIRRPGCIPFALSEKEWRALPLFQKLE